MMSAPSWHKDMKKMWVAEIAARKAKKMADDFDVEVHEKIMTKHTTREEYREEVFGGLSEEDLLKAAMKMFPENFV